MQHAPAPLVNFHASAQQAPVVETPGLKHQPCVGFTGQDEPHIDPARCCALQRFHQLRVGREIGVGEVDARLGIANGRQQRGIDKAERVLGRAANGAHHIAAHRLRLWKPVAHFQRLLPLFCPDGQEQLLQLGHNRALQLQVGVAPSQGRSPCRVFFGPGRALEGAAGIHATDVDAAQKRGFAIDDEQLAVVALVHFPALAQRQRVDRVELQHANAAVLHLHKQRSGRKQRAHAVADQVDLHARTLLGDERSGKALAHFVVVKDVGFHMDVVARTFDGSQHGLVGGRPVAQQQHAVADGQRAADDGFFQCQMALKGIAVRRALRQPRQHGPALRRTQETMGTQQLRRQRCSARCQVRHQPGQATAAGAQAQHAQHQQPALHACAPASAAQSTQFIFQGI